MLDRRSWLASFALLALGPKAMAQDKGRFRIGMLVGNPGTGPQRVWETELAKYNYVEGQNVVFVRRFADGHYDRLSALADELVREKPDLILAAPTPAVLAVKQATSTIPIVFGAVGDAVGSGIVSNLARPGGNLTGNSFLGPEIAIKQLQFVREILPSSRRLAFVANGAFRPELTFFDLLQMAVRNFDLIVDLVDVRRPEDIVGAGEEIQRLGADIVLVAPGGLSNHATNRQSMVDMLARIGKPALYFRREYVDQGGLMSYGANFDKLFQRQIAYADRILRGTKPGDLPVEQPSSLDLVVNLKTARMLGLSVPAAIVARADEVIE